MLRGTLRNIRSLLSAIFRLAIQRGYLNGPNPIREVSIPTASEGADTYAYSLEEVTRLLMHLPQPAYTIAAVAAFTGLRRSELTGLTWENYSGDEISVTRSVWEGHVNEPKTRKSKAPVPVIAPLRRILDAHREQCARKTGVMFATEKGTPLNLKNVLNRMILPVLTCVFHAANPKANTSMPITISSAILRVRCGTAGMRSVGGWQPTSIAWVWQARKFRAFCAMLT